MIIDKYDWHFIVDIKNTQLMYNDRIESLIDAHNQLPELVDFFIELGIDIQKPDEYNSGFSDVVYTFIGSAKSETKNEIDMYGNEKYISIVVYNKNNTVLLEVFGMN